MARGGGTEGGVGACSSVSQVMTTKSQILKYDSQLRNIYCTMLGPSALLHCLDLPTQINIGLIKAQRSGGMCEGTPILEKYFCQLLLIT